MPTRTFQLKVVWKNKDWDYDDMLAYIQTEVKTGEGALHPDERPDIMSVKINDRP